MRNTDTIADEARYQRAVARLEAINAEDPRGREPAHASALLGWILALCPAASEALLLAGRAQHMGRWRIPRDTYPEGRAGYLRWRRDLQAFHADQAHRVLMECGYPAAFADRVGSLVRKERLGVDPETQVLEDALCLVFIEGELETFRRQHDEAKLQRILGRTWVKMSEQGRQTALGLALPESVKTLLVRSLPGRHQES